MIGKIRLDHVALELVFILFAAIRVKLASGILAHVPGLDGRGHEAEGQADQSQRPSHVDESQHMPPDDGFMHLSGSVQCWGSTIRISCFSAFIPFVAPLYGLFVL